MLPFIKRPSPVVMYHMQLKKDIPVALFILQVWCDMVTDGGGFMLIGVQNSAVSWDVPSNSSLVHPLDSRHWSSAFGDKDVRDFRVQISTSKNFNNTEAHWYETEVV